MRSDGHRIVLEAFRVVFPGERVDPTTRFGELEEWDSLNRMRLLLACEGRMEGALLDPERVRESSSVIELIALVDEARARVSL